MTPGTRPTCAASFLAEPERAAPYLPLVLARLADPDPAQRADAAGLLGLLGEAARPAASQVVALVDDPDPRVRLAAVVTLGEMATGEERAVRAVASQLADPDLALRRASTSVLAGFGADSAPAADALRGASPTPTPRCGATPPTRCSPSIPEVDSSSFSPTRPRNSSASSRPSCHSR